MVLLVVGVFLAGQVSSAQVLADQARIDLTVPADAKVFINGYLTQSTGVQRSYQSINLKPGQVYPYRIVVEVVRNGQPTRREEIVSLRAGELRRLNLQGGMRHVVMKPPISPSEPSSGPNPEPPRDLPPMLPPPGVENIIFAGSTEQSRLIDSKRLSLLSVPAPVVPKEDTAAYFAAALEDLKKEGAELPDLYAVIAKLPAPGPLLWPSVVLDGEGEAYVGTNFGGYNSGPTDKPRLVVRTTQRRDVTGVIVFPSPKEGVLRVHFTLPAKSASPAARSLFYRVKQTHYQQLTNAGLPGTAWFRHQVRQCQATVSGVDPLWRGQPLLPPSDSRTEMMEWFDILTGGRAISENLWLDRQLTTVGNQRLAVSIESLGGINIPPFDWPGLVAGLNPTKDPLAARIPGDQHAVFFPSIEAAVRLAREASARETVVLRLAQPRSEHSRIRERYEQQFCLTLDRLAEILRPDLAHSVALTGSDPFVAMGTDVALLIESPDPKALVDVLAREIDLTAQKSGPVEAIKEEILGLACRGVRSVDRRISSYVAVLDDQTVVVTNSTYQLQRLAYVRADKNTSLASLPEYTWFRNRYRSGDPQETALLVISDSTIRRWCGPRWRIGQARRIWNAAVLAEAQAVAADQLVRGRGDQVDTRPDLSTLPEGVELGRYGVYSPVHGSPEFLTPVAELPLDWTTEEEANAYNEWRRSLPAAMAAIRSDCPASGTRRSPLGSRPHGDASGAANQVLILTGTNQRGPDPFWRRRSSRNPRATDLGDQQTVPARATRCGMGGHGDAKPGWHNGRRCP